MADTKISALPAASVAALANEYVINEAGVSKKVTGTQLKTLVSTSPTFTGTVSGVTKAMVGLTSVDDTSDAAKPVSTAQQTALNLKADLASPSLTGTPVAPTATAGTNTTQLATTAFVAAAVPNARYDTLMVASGSITGGVNSGTFSLDSGGVAVVSGGNAVVPPSVINIVSTDYPTVNGATPKLRIRVTLNTNDVAPGGTFTFGLYPITRPGTSGGSGVCIYTLGTVVTGSNGATFSSPAADGSLGAAGADFALPANGQYVIGFVTSSNIANNAHVHMVAHLQMRNA